MSDYDYEYDTEQLHKQAVRKLVDAHREEYDALTGRFEQERIQELERRIVDLQRQVLNLKGQNPNGTLVPALEQTANALAKENDDLVRLNKKLTADLAATKKQLADIKKAVGGKVPA